MIALSQKLNREQILNQLQDFTGSESYHRYNREILFSEGVYFLAETCDCYWLLDIIYSYQSDSRIKNEEFQVYKLKVNPDNSAIVTIEDGNDKIIKSQELEFTDFPLVEINIWFVNNIIYLPREH